MTKDKLIHATGVNFLNKGILLIGAPGSGKSDLAYRIISKGGCLVADDVVSITVDESNVLEMSYPKQAEQSLKGHMELRGIGIICVNSVLSSRLDCVLNMTPASQIERLPSKAAMTLFSQNIPLYDFDPTAVSWYERLNLIMS